VQEAIKPYQRVPKKARIPIFNALALTETKAPIITFNAPVFSSIELSLRKIPRDSLLQNVK
jgi:hypothetical protein